MPPLKACFNSDASRALFCLYHSIDIDYYIVSLSIAMRAIGGELDILCDILMP